VILLSPLIYVKADDTCDTNQYVKNKTCVNCPDFFYNENGDNRNGGDTYCTGYKYSRFRASEGDGTNYCEYLGWDWILTTDECTHAYNDVEDDSINAQIDTDNNHHGCTHSGHHTGQLLVANNIHLSNCRNEWCYCKQYGKINCEPNHYCVNGFQIEHDKCGPGFGVPEDLVDNLPSNTTFICEVCNSSDHKFSVNTDYSACEQHMECPAGFEPDLTKNNTHNPDCIPCRQNFFTGDTKYAPCIEKRNCTEAEYLVSDGDATVDRTCAIKTCNCSYGTHATGTNCTTHHTTKCVSCNAGYYLKDGVCTACESGKHQTRNLFTGTSCTNNICTCAQGTHATGTNCTTHHTTKCVSCNAGYYLKDGVCTACETGKHQTNNFFTGTSCTQNVCTCVNGTDATGTNCTDHNTAKCVSCNAGYYLVNDICKRNICTCAQGTHVANTDCPSNGEEKCMSCNAGYYLKDDVCTACETGKHQTNNFFTGTSCTQNVCTCANGIHASGTDCTSHGGEKCKSCYFGHYLENNVCKKNICTCAQGTHAVGTNCPTNGQEKCVSCNSGYLESGLCVAECNSDHYVVDNMCTKTLTWIANNNPQSGDCVNPDHIHAAMCGLPMPGCPANASLGVSALAEGASVQAPCPSDQIGTRTVTCSGGTTSEVSDCTCPDGLTPNDEQTQCLDGCGIPNGDNTDCADCAGVLNGTAVIDACGQCGGGNFSMDECGVCFGDNSTCEDCAGVPNGDTVRDACEWCGGDNSTCCAGNPCDPDNTVECIDDSSFNCICKSGYTSPYCNIPKNCTDTYDVGDVAEGSSVQVSCPAGKVGVRNVTCEQEVQQVNDEGCRDIADLKDNTKKQAARQALKNGMPADAKATKGTYDSLADRKSAQQAAKSARRDYLIAQQAHMTAHAWKDAVVEDEDDFEGYSDELLAKRQARKDAGKVATIRYRAVPDLSATGCDLNNPDLELTKEDGIDVVDPVTCVTMTVKGETGVVKMERKSNNKFKLTCKGGAYRDNVESGAEFECQGRVWDIGSIGTEMDANDDAGCVYPTCDCATAAEYINAQCCQC